jgi:hypothetical protein
METSIPINRNNSSTKAFHWTVAFFGVFAFVYSAFNLPLSLLGLNFAFIFVFTIGLGSRVAIHFNVFKSSISVTDVFVYLVAILYGGEASCILAAVEGYVTSSRFAKSQEYRAFNSGISAFSVFIASQISFAAFGRLSELMQSGITLKLVSAVAVVIVFHYIVNTLFVAISTSLRTEKPVLTIWWEYFLWMFVPFLASGSIALIAANTIQNSGFYAFLIVLPIVGVIYFGYHSQQAKVQATTAQADQAKRHLIEMTESEARFRSAFSNAPIGIALMNPFVKSLAVPKKNFSQKPCMMLCMQKIWLEF